MTAAACWDLVETPIGTITVVVDREGTLVRISFGERWRVLGFERTDRSSARCGRATGQLAEYFDRGRREFELEIRPAGSEFQLRVWREVAAIPYGETRSYGEVAARIGGDAVARAVGSANGANPIPIVIPCHRVIGADGSLVGYGGGLEAKAVLLRLEGVRLGVLDQLQLDL